MKEGRAKPFYQLPEGANPEKERMIEAMCKWIEEGRPRSYDEAKEELGGAPDSYLSERTQKTSIYIAFMSVTLGVIAMPGIFDYLTTAGSASSAFALPFNGWHLISIGMVLAGVAGIFWWDVRNSRTESAAFRQELLTTLSPRDHPELATFYAGVLTLFPEVRAYQQHLVEHWQEHRPFLGETLAVQRWVDENGCHGNPDWHYVAVNSDWRCSKGRGNDE